MTQDFQDDLALHRRRASVRRWLLLGALALGLPLLAWGTHAWINRDRGPASAPAPPAPARLRSLAPGLSHLELRGEGYALGLAHGHSLRGEVREVARFLNTELLGGVGRDWALRKAWKLDPFVPERYRQEMKGVADGAGLRYSDILLINTFDDLQHVSGCSSAVVLGSGGGPLRHARNLDYPIPFLARHKVVFDLETRGTRLRTVGFPGFVGILTGMSDRGLGLSSHTSASRRTAFGEPSGILYRRLLEEARGLEELERLLQGARRTLGNNLALSDARLNEGRALEFDARGLVGRSPEGGRLFVTNHFQRPELRPYQNEGWWAPGSGSSARVACLARSLPPSASPAPADLLAALSERGPGQAWRTPSNAGTVQSVLMEPGTGRLWVARGQTPPVTDEGYVELPGRW